MDTERPQAEAGGAGGPGPAWYGRILAHREEDAARLVRHALGQAPRRFGGPAAPVSRQAAGHRG
jgi:hypothetical protein